MNREEAINRFKEIRQSFSISIAQSKFYPSKDILDELCNMAISALSTKTNDKGEWIRWFVEIEDETGVLYIPHAKCSNCGSEQDAYTTQFINFCPYCGARMKSEVKDI